jgi:hypothetical protein
VVTVVRVAAVIGGTPVAPFATLRPDVEWVPGGTDDEREGDRGAAFAELGVFGDAAGVVFDAIVDGR